MMIIGGLKMMTGATSHPGGLAGRIIVMTNAKAIGIGGRRNGTGPVGSDDDQTTMTALQSKEKKTCAMCVFF